MENLSLIQTLRHILRKRSAKFAALVIGTLMFLSAFAVFIANDKPITAVYQGQRYYPAFKQIAVEMGLSKWPPEFLNVEWHSIPFTSAWWPLIRYTPESIQSGGGFMAPGSSMDGRAVHWLGTTKLGQDVAATLVYGSRYALLLGLVSMAVALLIGLFFGSLAGYYGNNGLQISILRLGLNLLFLFPAWFYGVFIRNFYHPDTGNILLSEILISIFIFSAIMGIANAISWGIEKIAPSQRRIALPADFITSRFIEIFTAIPPLLLILTMLSIGKSSMLGIAVIIGIASWANIARLIRAELLRIRHLDFIAAAKTQGNSNMRILFRHALPNAMRPVLITLMFGMASAVLAEAFLSFLGLQPNVHTWGRLLYSFREHPSAWWVAACPGFMIFMLVTALHHLATAFDKH